MLTFIDWSFGVLGLLLFGGVHLDDRINFIERFKGGWWLMVSYE